MNTLWLLPAILLHALRGELCESKSVADAAAAALDSDDCIALYPDFDSSKRQCDLAVLFESTDVAGEWQCFLDKGVGADGRPSGALIDVGASVWTPCVRRPPAPLADVDRNTVAAGGGGQGDKSPPPPAAAVRWLHWACGACGGDLLASEDVPGKRVGAKLAIRRNRGQGVA